MIDERRRGGKKGEEEEEEIGRGGGRKGKRRWKWRLSDMEAKFSLCTEDHKTSYDIIRHHKTT